MTEVLHANIFFFITGIAVIVFTALFCVLLFHGIKVVKSLRRIMDRVEEGTEIIAEDMQNVRTYFAEGGIVRLLISKLFGSSKEGRTREQKSRRPEKKRTELTINDESR